MPKSYLMVLAFNFLLLPAGILAYLQGVVFGLWGAGISLAVLLWYIFYVRIDFISMIPTFIAFFMTPLAFGVLREVFEGMESQLSEDISKSEKMLELMRNKEIKLNSQLKELDKKVSDIASLYEMTKEMSAALLFNDIFQILSEFLRKNFKFISCKLILVKKNQDLREIEKVYRVEGSLGGVYKSGVSAAPDLVDSEILNSIYEKKSVIYWEDFIAIPLISQSEIIGVLNVEGLEEAALDRFLIVSRQFSLEIEKVRLYETVQELAITDGLTGIFVRRYFLERFKEELERSLTHNFKLSFLMIDLDHFKKCNDKFGHLVGDVILKEVARVLKLNVREIDLIGRYGGEEFSILLPETDRAGAIHVAGRLREAVGRETFKAYDEVLKMTISVGVSTFPEDTHVSSELIEAADKALYEAKSQGRNRVVAFKR